MTLGQERLGHAKTSITEDLHHHVISGLAMQGAYQGDLIFAAPDGRHLDPDVVSQRFDRLVTVAEVPNIRFHDLRHTHATLLPKARQPVKVVSERLGHAKVSTTMDLCQHVIPGMQREAAAAFAAMIGETV